MPNETYNVTLFFTEIYWDQPNARLFTVSANNRTVVSKYDIYTAAGEIFLLMQSILPKSSYVLPFPPYGCGSGCALLQTEASGTCLCRADFIISPC